MPRLEIYTLGHAIQKYDKELFQSIEGAEGVCTTLGKVVSLHDMLASGLVCISMV